MDNMLIEFWRQHECLFNSSIEAYYDKHLKTKLWAQFAQSIGKPVSDVERRSRSLRTQYGRLLWRPDRIKTFQQTMLKEKLDFLRPYIIRRRGGEEDNFNDDDEEGEETEGSMDQETGSVFGSLLDADVTGPDPCSYEAPSYPQRTPADPSYPQRTPADPSYEARSQASTPSSTPLLCPPSQNQVTEVVMPSSSGGGNNVQNDVPDVVHHHPSREERTEESGMPRRHHHDVLNQFAAVMLADMRQIRDPLVLMRLRRDVTDLVFKAAEEDAMLRQRAGRASLLGPLSLAAAASSGGSGGFRGGYARAQDASACLPIISSSPSSRRQRFLERRNRGIGRRIQKWEMMRRAAAQGQRTHHHHPGGGGAMQGGEQERTAETSSQPVGHTLETKAEFEPQMIKIEEEMLPVV